MHISYIRHQFNIYGYQIIVGFCLVFLLVANEAKAQIPGAENLPNFDEQSIHFGFMIGGQSSRFRMKYSDDFVTPAFDSLHSILPVNSGGFKVGFLVDFHLLQYLDFRIIPTFGLYQLGLDYRFDTGEVINELRDPTYFELPLLFKYKSVRRKNRVMYALIGLSPSIKVSGAKKEDDSSERLLLNKFNLALEIGAGMDLFQPFFKFSPEIRYSFGLFNVLDSEKNSFSEGIDKLTLHSFTIYVSFEGGPSSIKRRGKKRR